MNNSSNILHCAMQLFAQKGYDAVGVQEIVDTAGITKPTLYHYYGSKRGLLDSIIAEHTSKFFPLIDEASAYNRDVITTLSSLTNVYFTFANEHNNFYRMLLSMWFAPPESEVFNAILPVMQRQQKVFEDFFLRAAEDHGNMKNRHQIYASTFLGMLNTYIGLMLNNFVKPDKALVHRLVHQYMHGIFS